ncbi:MAG: hypothetical protein MI923_08145 [Phycisphaerales bacterium]|nr:hypothetical protein [Phycisphaerales bacterium]
MLLSRGISAQVHPRCLTSNGEPQALKAWSPVEDMALENMADFVSLLFRCPDADIVSSNHAGAQQRMWNAGDQKIL